MMKRPSSARFRVGGVTLALGVALAVAGCGSSSSSSSTASSPVPGASSTGSSGAGGGLKISTSKGSNGTYLTGPSGKALYLWVADASGRSSCSSECAKFWPPLIAKGKLAASGGVNSSDLGTIARSDGSKQVTYNGHPLYYFVADSHPGMTNGQGNNGFGAKWWLVSPSGSAITASGSSTTTPSSGYSSAYG